MSGGPITNKSKNKRKEKAAPYATQSSTTQGDARNDIRQRQNKNNPVQNVTVQPESSGPKLTEVFIGHLPFLTHESHAKAMRGLLKEPKSMFMVQPNSNQLAQIELPDTMKCRSLIVCLSPKWYARNATDFFDETGNLTHANKMSGACTAISNDIQRAVAKYKPMRTYVEMNIDESPTQWSAILASVAILNDYVIMNLNPLGRNKIPEVQADKRPTLWAARVKFYLHSFHPKDRSLAQLSPGKGINVNEL